MKITEAHLQLCKADYNNVPVILFVYEDQEYPAVYFTSLYQKLSVEPSIIIKNVTMLLEEKEQLDAQIHTTFLGQIYTLWLGNISSLSLPEDRSRLLRLCSMYKGPHRLVMAISAEHMSKKNMYSGCVYINQEEIAKYKKEILSFLYPTVTFSAIEQLLHTASCNSLDVLIMLAQYALVIGKNTDLFVQQWLMKVMPADLSLFTLSQYFFSKKPKQFFAIWHSIKNIYPATFWVAYWSEQVWRAYFVITMQQNKKVLDARKMAYRLPFSFIQKDWRTLSLQTLSSMHSLLCDIDWRIKNGGSEDHFEYIFSSFFNTIEK